MVTRYLMDNEPIFFGILFLGAFGYWIASGAIRANYRLLHVTLGVALFFVFGLGTYYIIEQWFDVHAAWGIIGAFVVITITAYLWRRWIAELVFQYLRDLGITTTSFGPSRAWDILESTPGREFHYIRVHLESGGMLGSNQNNLSIEKNEDRLDFEPDVITDEQGNVALIVTEKWGKNDDEPKTATIIDEDGCTKFTYIPASNITKIEAYIKPKQ